MTSSIPTPQETCSAADGGSCTATPNHPPIDHVMNSVFMAGGKIGPLLQTISFTADNMERTILMLSHTIHPIDIVLLVVAGFGIIPLGNILYNTYYHQKTSNDASLHPYKSSYLYGTAKVMSEMAQIAILVYLIDCGIVIAIGLGLHTYKIENASYVLAKIVYIAWGAKRLSQFKRYILGTLFSRHPDKLGRISILDRLMDGILFLSTGVLLLEVLDMEMGSSLKSLFAFGSAGTLIMGLASRDLATMFVNGLTLSTTNRLNEGDDIKFGDGTAGIVQNIGWIHTVIRNYDNLIEIVPNSQLGMQRVKNLSRVDMCRVQQNLRFHYKDIDLLPKVFQDIVQEIEDTCPTVITDGTRPLRAVFVNYREDFLQVVVTAHFHCKPVGQEFYETQQSCLFAINNAVKKNKIQFVTTFYPQVEPQN